MSSNPEIAKFHLGPEMEDRIYHIHNEMFGMLSTLTGRPIGNLHPTALIPVMYIKGVCMAFERLLPAHAKLNGGEILSPRQAREMYPEAIPTKEDIDRWLKRMHQKHKEALAEANRLMKSAAGVRLKSEDSE